MEVSEGTALSKPEFPKCIAVDTNFLIAWISSKTTEDKRGRIEHFLTQVEKAKAKIIIPMPIVAEYLVLADHAGLEIFNGLERKAFIFMAPFDRAAAFECALLDRAALNSGDKKDGAEMAWQKIKIDRQIVAIAKACGASLLITDDDNIHKNALRFGISAIGLNELELPHSARQQKLELVIKDNK